MKYTSNDTFWPAKDPESQTETLGLYLIGSNDLNKAIFKDLEKQDLKGIFPTCRQH